MAEEGLTVLGWRDVPVDPECLGKTAREAMPTFQQLFVSSPGEVRRRPRPPRLCRPQAVEHEHRTGEDGRSYFASLSARTIVYKGMLTTPQLGQFFPDLTDERVESALCWCTRGSRPTRSRRGRWRTRTGMSPTTARSTPCRATRTGCAPARRCCQRALPGLDTAFPICTPGASDTARFDEVLELLHLGGRPLHHAVLMMIPEAWENHDEMDAERRAFYRFHAS